MSTERTEQVHDAVRRRYARTATSGSSCCASDTSSSCCSGEKSLIALSKRLGYSERELRAVPEGSNLGLGCGNPAAIAALKVGERVLDLGSGAGFDCFLAAKQVGMTGHVIGVDMTPEMIVKARENARKGGYQNVDFRLGEIEHVPVADASVDVVISNCVINLSPDKPAVYRETFRVLVPGGRLAVSDVVATAELPDHVKTDLNLLAGCVSGAEQVDVLEAMIREAGFENVRITPKDNSRAIIKEWDPGRPIHEYVVSASIEATKPMG